MTVDGVVWAAFGNLLPMSGDARSKRLRSWVSGAGVWAMTWQPIATAPKDGRFILLHVPKGLESGTVTVGGYWKAEDRDEAGRFAKGNWDGWLGMDADVLSSWCDPTHWMPLPEPPNG